jgi:hypothetical protein
VQEACLQFPLFALKGLHQLDGGPSAGRISFGSMPPEPGNATVGRRTTSSAASHVGKAIVDAKIAREELPSSQQHQTGDRDKRRHRYNQMNAIHVTHSGLTIPAKASELQLVEAFSRENVSGTSITND